MKKVIGVILFVIAVGFWWSHSSKEAAAISSKKTAEEIVADDYRKITLNLKPENIENNEWKEINDYTKSPSSLVNPKNALSFFQTAQNNIPDLYLCLKKDFCGMRTRDDNDAYFDDQKTPAHILLNRNLQIMKASLKVDHDLVSQVNWDILIELANSEEELLQVSALEILREFDQKSITTADLLKISENYTGTRKAEALLKLSKKSNSRDKALIANDIEEVFAMADADTVISVLENMKKMALGVTQVTRALKNLCHWKASHNWPIILQESIELQPDFEKNCN